MRCGHTGTDSPGRELVWSGLVGSVGGMVGWLRLWWAHSGFSVLSVLSVLLVLSVLSVLSVLLVLSVLSVL